MSGLYCDTSVVVAYYVPEVHSQQAERALAAQPKRVVSPLVLTEARSALRRKVHDKALGLRDAQEAWKDLRRDVAEGMFALKDLERRHFEQAAALLWNTGQRLRALDALHLALAEAEGYALATADDLMARIAKELGLTVVWAGV